MASEGAKDAAITALYILAIVFIVAAIIIIVIAMATPPHTVDEAARNTAIALGVTGLIFVIVTYITTNYIVRHHTKTT